MGVPRFEIEGLAGGRTTRRRHWLHRSAAILLCGALASVVPATPAYTQSPLAPACDAPYGVAPAARGQHVPPLTFGVYPGGYAGGGTKDYVPNDPLRIQRSLDTLQGRAHNFLVRGYAHYHDAPTDGDIDAPEDATQYLRHGRRLDLVLVYEAEDANLAGWETYVRTMVRRYGRSIDTLAITLEVNTANDPVARQALVRGVEVAKLAARLDGDPKIQVGFNAINFGVPFDLGFWRALKTDGGPLFSGALDYVGIDLYAGVFSPVAPDGQPGDRRDVVTQSLRMSRNCSLPTAGLERDVALRITENGWPTGPDRSEDQQAATLRTTLQTIEDLRTELGIASYEAFALRDSRSSSPDIFNQFGIMRDDYSPKPAFDVYRTTIAEFGR